MFQFNGAETICWRSMGPVRGADWAGKRAGQRIVTGEQLSVTATNIAGCFLSCPLMYFMYLVYSTRRSGTSIQLSPRGWRGMQDRDSNSNIWKLKHQTSSRRWNGNECAGAFWRMRAAAKRRPALGVDSTNIDPSTHFVGAARSNQSALSGVHGIPTSGKPKILEVTSVGGDGLADTMKGEILIRISPTRKRAEPQAYVSSGDPSKH